MTTVTEVINKRAPSSYRTQHKNNCKNSKYIDFFEYENISYHGHNICYVTTTIIFLKRTRYKFSKNENISYHAHNRCYVTVTIILLNSSRCVQWFIKITVKISVMKWWKTKMTYKVKTHSLFWHTNFSGQHIAAVPAQQCHPCRQTPTALTFLFTSS